MSSRKRGSPRQRDTTATSAPAPASPARRPSKQSRTTGGSSSSSSSGIMSPPAAVPAPSSTADGPAAPPPPPLPPLTVLRRVGLDGTRPLTDPKHYRLVTLSNGLEALLIHDPRMGGGGGHGGASASAAASESDSGSSASGLDSETGEEDEDEEDGSGSSEDDDECGSSSSSCSDNQGRKQKNAPPPVLDLSASGPMDSHEVESPRRRRAGKAGHKHRAPHPHIGHGHGQQEAAGGSAAGENEEGEDDEEEGEDGSESGSAESEEEGGEEDGAAGVRLAAAAMAVGVGSFRDPENVQGLAHYLEHMLFMGSAKYPSENAYDAFLSAHGGYSNAMTECEYTVYHYEVPPVHAAQALDLFAQFFISPLMRPEASARELQAIESEFQLSRGNDATRCTQLVCHTCTPGHPYARFAWGNLQSLREEPMQAGVDINAELRAFHERYYVASNMKLVVLGMEDLDTQEQNICRVFSGVACDRPAPPTTLAGLPSPLTADTALGWLFRVIPYRDVHQLHLTWPLPAQLPHWRSKPWDYLGHLLGHEGKGSVLAELKRRGWATAIVAGLSGEGYDSSTGLALFGVTVTLTVEGVGRWEEVVGLVYAYLEGVLRQSGQPPQWVFEELKAIGRMQYRFQEEVEAGELAEQLATALLPMYGYGEAVLQAPFLLWEWRPDLITEVLSALTPQNCRVDILSSTFGRAGELEAQEQQQKGAPATVELESKPVEKEPRFGVHFTRERLSASLLEKWAGPHPPDSNPQLALPPPNPFVATDLTVKDPPPLLSSNPSSSASLGLSMSQQSVGGLSATAASSVASLTPDVEAALQELELAHPELAPALANIRRTPPVALPALVVEEAGLNLWHLQDRVFKMPRAAVFVKLATPEAYASPRHEVLTELLVRLVKDSLNETTYQASIAELHYACKATELGIELHFHGLSQRLLTLVELVLRRLLHFAPHLEEVRFRTQQEALQRAYANDDLKPSRYARNLRLQTLKEKMWRSEALLAEAQNVGPTDLLAFLPRLLARLHVDVLYHGNCDTADAHALASLLKQLLANAAPSAGDNDGGGGNSAPMVAVQPLPSAEYPTNRVVRLPEGRNLLLATESKDSGERNSALEAYWQLGKDCVEERVCVQMLEQVMDEPLYDRLRTKEQLGYSVSCGLRMTNGVLGFAVRVQSERYEPEHLHARVEAFLARFADKLRKMPDEEYYRHLTSLVQNKLQRDASLNDEGGRYWAEIIDRRYHFDVAHREVAGLLRLPKSRVQALFDAHIAVSAPQARHLCVRVTGQACRSRRLLDSAPSPTKKEGEQEASASPPKHHHHHHHHELPSLGVRSLVTVPLEGCAAVGLGEREGLSFYPNLT